MSTRKGTITSLMIDGKPVAPITGTINVVVEATCARCGLRFVPEAFVVGHDLGYGRPFCDACWPRAQMAIDWALAGDAVPEPTQARVEMLESWLCAIEFDLGAAEWQRERRNRWGALTVDQVAIALADDEEVRMGDIVFYDEVGDHATINGQRFTVTGTGRLVPDPPANPLQSFSTTPPMPAPPNPCRHGNRIGACAVCSGKSRNPFTQPQRFNRRGNRG